MEVLEGNLEFATLGLGFSADSRAKVRICTRESLINFELLG